MGREGLLESYTATFRGKLLERDDPGYDEARKVYNGMIDKHPERIARCADVADVMASVRFARETGMLAAVRGGGHNAGGLGVCDDGIVIDLSPMKGIHVNPKERTVRVEPGCVWSDVDHATHAFGMATPSGTVASTGVAGLALGGGIGHLTRKYGLTIDNLLSVDMISADGKPLTADERENPDLFWAVRGGGGNFGVVTSFLFRLHPVHTVIGGPMLWDLKDAAEVMPLYSEFIRSAPEEINGFFAFLTVPPGPPFPEPLHGRKMCGVIWCYTGAQERFEETFHAVRGFPKPAFELLGPMPFPALQSLFDPLLPPGLQWYWKADFINSLSETAVRLHIEHGSALPTPLSTTHFYPINGAAHRVGENDTAWAYRDATWAHVIVGIDPDPANRDRLVGWANAYWNGLHPHSAGGAYVNFMMHDEGQDRVKSTYRGNYDRLVDIKTKYDPDNFFRVNQNIRPPLGHGARSAA